jgi:drug/metabolite transporter (DMT)-like permease
MPPLFFLTALSASLAFGIGDFVGGRASAKIALVQVLVIGEVFGALLFWLFARLSNEAPLASEYLGLAVLTGAAGAIGVAALYHGIGQGHTAVTAPVTAAVSAIIPVLYGISTHGVPSTYALIGMGVGIIAIVLNSLAGRVSGFGGLWQGAVAGVAIGIFLILIKFVGSTGVYAPLVAIRAGALVITIPWLLLRPGSRPSASGIGLAMLAGVLDLTANAAYMLSTQMGRIDIASVLSSLYPAVTVLLARFINHERISPLQQVGLVLTLVATALIAL